MPVDIYNNDVNLIKYPTKFINRNVIINDNDIIENVDIIICATGYKKEFKFLDEKYYKTDLIKKMIPQNYPDIAFIGFARPTMGSIASIAEIQSWWVSQYFINKLNYKNRNYTWIRTNNPIDLNNDFINSLVIGQYYMKDLALDMNISPNLINIFLTDIKLWFHIITSTTIPTTYRLNGTFKHKNSRDILFDTLPSFKERTYENKKPNFMFYFLLLFLILHILYILIIVIITFLFLKMLIYKNIFPEERLMIYTIVISLVFLIYTYNNWL